MAISRRVFQIVPDRALSEADKRNGRTDFGDCLDKRIRLAIDDYSIQESSELVFLHGSDFEKIFGKRNPDYGTKLAVVKITNTRTKKSIHRLFRTSCNIHGIRNYVALSYNSLLGLSNDSQSLKSMDELELAEGSWLIYYWNHPINATKVALRVGVYSIIISIIGIFISIFY